MAAWEMQPEEYWDSAYLQRINDLPNSSRWYRETTFTEDQWDVDCWYFSYYTEWYCTDYDDIGLPGFGELDWENICDSWGFCGEHEHGEDDWLVATRVEGGDCKDNPANDDPDLWGSGY